MNYTSPRRPGEGELPAYRFVPAPPDPGYHGSTTGCFGCAFRRMPEVRCSRIPCHIPANRNKVAELISDKEPK